MTNRRIRESMKRYVEREDGGCHNVTDEQWRAYNTLCRLVGRELADKLFPYAAQYAKRQRKADASSVQ